MTFHHIILCFCLGVVVLADHAVGQSGFTEGSDDGCSSCLVDGQRFDGNTHFKYVNGCIEYRCVCNCDGGWNCPGETAVDRCNTDPDTGCTYCVVNNQRYDGNSHFKYVNGCIEYRCVCKCDGGWNCPAETAVDRCNTDPDTGCSNCLVDDQRYDGNSFFKHVNGCIEYRCTCNCDGSWSCPGEQAVDLCRQNQTSGCYYCEADGYLYQGNSRFPLVRDCYGYQCTCACDGGWTCKDSRGVYVCDHNGVAPASCKTCNIHGNVFRGSSRFYYDHDCIKYMCTCDCQGRYVCSGEDARVTCEGVTREVIPSLISGSDENARMTRQLNDDGCQNCVADGVTYPPNQDFTLDSGCNEFTCRCYCDGQYRCPPESRRIKAGCRGPSSGSGSSGTARGGAGIDVTDPGAGVSTCRQCEYKNVRYDGNTQFQFDDGCWRYACNCRCNGSFDCPSENSKYICPGQETCVQCKVDDRLIEPNTDFSIVRDCVTYDHCSCRCDGGWTCGDGIYTCTSCQSCLVDDDTFAGNSTFQLTRGCDLYTDCSCSCGGEWSCSGEGVEDVCGRCRMCNIGDNFYEGDSSRVAATVGCTRYGNCQCDCDGSWTCREGAYTCDRGDQPLDGQCQDCVHEGRRFRPGSSFDYSSGCTRYRRCECKCGETHCVEAEDICGDCRKCNVNGTEYKGGSQFSTKSDCFIYRNCDCFCDGRWECRGEGAIDTCNACRTCNVDGNTYEPYGRFTLSRDCWTYQCFCGCDGATRCPSLTAVNTCTSPDVCRACVVDDRDIPGNSHFTHDLAGMVMSCRCNCDGSHVCVAELLYIRADLSISGSGIGGGAGRCLSCNLNGHIYSGNTNFTQSRSGIDLECQCFCNGGYYCYGESTFGPQGCRGCEPFGLQYDGDSSFPLVYGGVKMDCSCECNGDYICAGATGQTSIQCIAGRGCFPPPCGKCIVDGLSFNGGDVFGSEYQGSQLRCVCGCDESYVCEGAGGVVISCRGGTCRQIGCGGCTVYGNGYAGKAEFDVIYRGVKLDCECNCNGDYECFGSSRELVVSCTGGGSGCLTRNCEACTVNGQQWAGRSQFRFDYTGIDMRCTCGCDGSYFCEGVHEQIEVSCFRGVCNRIGCPQCNIFGKRHDGDSSFEIIYTGTVMRCQCSCGGDYICRGSSGTQMIDCRNGGRGCLPTTCASCVVNGQEYAGLSMFRSSYKGIDIMCSCACDGSRHCTGVTNSIEISCIGDSCSRIGCKECNIFGTDYLGSSQLDIIHQGLKLTCNCDCEGGYVCVSSTGVSVVQCVNGVGRGCLRPPCRRCVVDGQRYDGGSRFSYLYNGIDMECTCACDSSYYCEGTVEAVEISCVGGRCRPLDCQQCRLYGRDYGALEPFNIIYAGLLLDCQCNCDGSYKCVGESGATVVHCDNHRGCLSQQCRECGLDGRDYTGGTKFRYNYNGIDVSCECGCDGSLHCKGISETVTLTCVGGVCTPVGCQTCRVYGERYAALSQFEIIYSGLKLRCTCDCTGGYMCREPTGTTTVTCRDRRGCLSQECASCDLNGRQYRGLEIFKYDYKDIDMSCTCGCDGSVFCEGITSGIELRCIGGSCTPMGCQNCDVFGRQYRTLTAFDIIYQGIRLTCECACDKSYTCRGSNNRPVVTCTSSGSGCLPSDCRSCVRNDIEYTGESTYTDTYNGIEMSCVCGCDGSSFCTGTKEVLEVSCLGDSCSPVGCRTCHIFGQQYPTVSDFSIIYEGVRLQCRCNCDASFICRGSSGEVVVECASGSCHLPTTCRNCIVEGHEHRASSRFPYVYNGIDMNCECGCDGTSFCEGITEIISVSCIGQSCSPVGCRNCNIFGQDYAGESQFDIIYRGTRLRCDCNCDTSYRCVGTSPEQTIDCSIGRRCLPARCKKCRVLGTRHDGGSSFQFEWQGYDMSCVCGCDGSYYCRGEATDIELSCTRRGDCHQIGGCRSCDIYGQKYAGGSRKEFVYQGYFMTCTCDCDSSYKCIGVKGDTVITCPAGRDCLDVCGTCTADGRQYEGTTVFQTRYNNKDYDCTCGCDGSFFCRCRTSDIKLSCLRENQCEQIGCNTCLSEGIERPAESEFEKMYDGIRMDCFCNCDGSYRCQGRIVTIVITCSGDRCNLVGCRSCVVDGQEYPSERQYEITNRGRAQICECRCDGSSNCKDKEPIRPVCNTCVIDGQTYQGHTQNRHHRAGESYICICQCDGTHNCYLERCPTGDCVTPQPNRCHDCEIFGTTHRGDTQFSTVNRGNAYECDCRCNGTWKCVSELFTWSCEGTGCRPTKCQPCLISGRRHEGDTRFTTTVEGRRMDCGCNCDASYRCVGENYVCTERGCKTTCRDCVINGVSYRGSFESVMQGTRMQCSCDCSGNYRCEGADLRCTSQQGCVSTCRSCTIDGISYTGSFQTQMQGVRMQCSCDCAGRYSCTGGDWKCTSERGCVRECRECVIDNRRHGGNTQFTAILQNTRMNCDCSCNGNYRCEGGNWVCTSGTGCVSTCPPCSIDGRALAGNGRDTLYVFGDTMECSCDCSGRYNCQSDRQTCSSVAGCVQSCQRCDVNGRQYGGGSTFQATLQGILMDCSCDCSGSYTCHGGTYTCTTTRGCVDSCPGCTIEGQLYKGNSRFEVFYKGYGIMMACDCSCGGSYTCKGTTETSRCVGEGCDLTKCRNCVVKGQTYAGNTKFETDLDGIRMRCDCYCTGGYKCKGKTSTTTCTGPGCSRDPNECQSCIIGGNTYRGRSNFQVDREGIRMNCTCRCDGSYKCKGEKTTTTCVGPGCGNTCGPCNVDGRVVAGNTRFETDQNGVTLQCTCRCDGGYSCEGSQTTQTCTGPGCTTTGCRRCIIDERPYTGNTRFTIRKSNLEYHCSCFCDGSYTCESSQGVTSSCVGASCAADSCRNCNLDGREYELDARFRLTRNRLVMNCVCECDGAYRCFSISGTCTGSSCDEYGCRSCTIDGRPYKGNAQYEIQRGRDSLICTCDCTGEYQCRTASLQVECVGESCGVGQGACKRCSVDGKRYTGNSRFVITAYGLHMQCACNCDSSYTCRGYQIIVDPAGAEYTDACKQCEINGQLYNGNTRFQAMIQNVRSICSCQCDGTYSCQGSETTCRRCIIGGVTYETNSDFTLTRNGNSINCHCGCNGDFVCQGSGQCVGVDCGRNIGGCRECIIFGTRYRSETRFTTDSGGIRMLCECSCSGEYSCKGYRSVTSIILPSEQRTACTTCLVGGQQKEGNSRFKIQRGCFKVNCVCDCDGNWECPQQVPEYACAGIEQYHYSLTGSQVYITDDAGTTDSRTVITGVDPSSTVIRTGACRSCDVNGKDYPGNTAFMLQHGCLRFTCRCDCTGGWNCSSVQGSDCSGNSDTLGQSQCRECFAFGNQYTPNRRFVAEDKCYRYSCMCECDGSWECPRELTVRTCTEETNPYDERTGNCRQCVVGGGSYDHGTTFEFVDDCVRYRCQCSCDGSYNCPAADAVRVCRSGAGAAGRLSGTGSNTPSRGTGSSTVGIISPGSSSSSSSSYSSSSSSTGSTRTSVGTSRTSGGSVGTSGTYSTGVSVGRGSAGGTSSGGSRTSGGTTGNVYRTSPVGGGSSSSTGGSGAVDLASTFYGGGDSCLPCDVNGQFVKGGRDFSFRAGCVEFLCECFCNGTYVCPRDKSTRFCDVDRSGGSDNSQSVGCTVGNRTYRTKLFSYTENCIKYVCRCQDDGSYNCDDRKSRRVC